MDRSDLEALIDEALTDESVRPRLIALRERYARRPAFQRRLDERAIPAAER